MYRRQGYCGHSLGAHAEREERHLAYVAMTRARSIRLLVGPWIYRTGSTMRQFPRYLTEARAQLFGDAPDLIDDMLMRVGDRGVWARGDRRSLGIESVSGAGVCLAAPESGDEDIVDSAAGMASVSFPEKSGPSRQRVAAAAQAVEAQIRDLAQDQDVYKALVQLGDGPAVRDTVALIEEYHLGLETPVVDLQAERAPAASVSALLQDADEFARDMR